MRLRLTESVASAAAKAAINVPSAYRIEHHRRLPSQKQEPRRRRRFDPLLHVFENDVVPILEGAPAIGWVTVFEELQRRHPELTRGVREY